MGAPGLRFVLVTLDHHATAAVEAVRGRLAREVPGLDLRFHVAADWDADPDALERCRADLRHAHVVVLTQLFMRDHVDGVLDVLRERRDGYDALACFMCEGDLVRTTRLGGFDMGGGEEAEAGGRFSPRALLKRLRGSRRDGSASGKRQMLLLKGLPKLLRFVPGPAQDVRAYLLSMRYWLSASEENLRALVLHLVGRYAEPSRLGGGVPDAPAPVRYPEEGLYHPSLPGPGLTQDPADVPVAGDGGRVGLLLMRSHLLAGNTAHYDAVIEALERRGLACVPAFASGLDNRTVAERFFVDADGRAAVDALVSLTGFGLVGGPAYADTDAARALLEGLDVPYLAFQPLEFQTVEAWQDDPRGLSPLQAALMVALPEMDGATGPLVFGGHGDGQGAGDAGSARPILDRVERAAERVARWVELRRTPPSERRVAVVLFNFPPNAGAVGTAAYLDVFASLHATLRRLADEGYDVEVPGTVDALRSRLLDGNREMWGAPANVHARVPADDHVQREPWLDAIEDAWGPAPGRHLTDGASLFVCGERFGNVFVGVQPPFGYEGDPMRLLFEGSFAPTHAFAAFYRWLREDFGAHAALHFGTHGALEFMPGKQVGLSSSCWPDRLVGDLPNVYLYAANNPSEGTLAKRRAAATLVTYLTPATGRAGLYKGLLALEAAVDGFRAGGPADGDALDAIRAQADALDLVTDGFPWEEDPGEAVARLRDDLAELERALVPHGLHVLGRTADAGTRVELLEAAAEAVPAGRGVPTLERLFGRSEAPSTSLHGAGSGEVPLDASAGADPSGQAGERRALRDAVEALVAGATPSAAGRPLVRAGADPEAARALLEHLARMEHPLKENGELDGLVRALDGRFVPPAPGGDLLRNPDVLPTGRNLYGFDPYGLPSSAGQAEGRVQAERILARYREDRGALPESLAFVLWGTDNMKREGAPLAQVLALMGVEPVFDAYGRLCDARLIPLEELGRPRIDVVVTTSGIFRDLLPLQTRLLARAALLAATADEPAERNYVRKRTLALRERLGCTPEEAALRVFSNADGAYGANVNQQVDGGAWQDEGELDATFLNRKGFAYGADARPVEARALLKEALSGVEAAYQNLDSVELGVTDVDQYMDSLGGMAGAAARLSGTDVPVYIGDETRSRGKVRTLREQVALETRTRILNPRWYESMLDHGYQGVRELEARATTALGWSATTGEVDEWVYARVGETFVLDPEMRRRLAALNPGAAARMAGRLVEATDRGYWSPDPETLDALRDAHDELEDTLEGIGPEVAA